MGRNISPAPSTKTEHPSSSLNDERLAKGRRRLETAHLSLNNASRPFDNQVDYNTRPSRSTPRQPCASLSIILAWKARILIQPIHPAAAAREQAGQAALLRIATPFAFYPSPDGPLLLYLARAPRLLGGLSTIRVVEVALDHVQRAAWLRRACNIFALRRLEQKALVHAAIYAACFGTLARR